MSNTMFVPKRIPECTCLLNEVAGRSLATKFLTCPVLYTAQPYPISCIHNTSFNRFPPPPRLVGIELNPGPRKKVIQTVLVPVAASAILPKKGSGRGRKGKTIISVLKKYLRSYMNPFMWCPPVFGYDCFTPTALDVGWTKQFGLGLNAGSTCFAAIFNPETVIINGGAFGAAASSYLKTCSSVSSGNTLTSDTAPGQFPPVNAANYISRVDTHRVVTGALRVTVRYPLSAAPGRMFGFLLFESDSNLATNTFTGVATLEESVPIAFDGSGVQIIQVNYKPNDNSAFLFTNPSGVISAATNFPKMVVVGLGWTAANFSVDIEVINHNETQCGALSVGTINEDFDELALSVTKDRLAHILRDLPTTLSKTDLQQCQMSALKGAEASHRNVEKKKKRGANPLSHATEQMTSSVLGEAACSSSSGSGSFGDYVNVGAFNKLTTTLLAATLAAAPVIVNPRF